MIMKTTMLLLRPLPISAAAFSSSCSPMLRVYLLACGSSCPPMLRAYLLPYKVVEVSTSKMLKHNHAKCHIVGIDIFTGKKLEDIVPSSHNCDVCLLTDNSDTKDALCLQADEELLSKIKDGFAEGKDLILTIMRAMGEEHICAVKDIGKN